MLWYKESVRAPGAPPDPDSGGLHVDGGRKLGSWPMRGRTARLIGITLRHGVLRRILGVPATALTAPQMAIMHLPGLAGSRLAQRLAEAADAESGLLAFIAHLRQYALPRNAISDLAQRAASHIATTRSASLTSTATEHGVSERTLQRIFAKHVGLTPKSLVRIERIRAALAHAHGRTTPDWSNVACDLGFSDQAHLVRTFTAAVGIPPERYRRIVQGAGIRLDAFIFLRQPPAPAADPAQA